MSEPKTHYEAAMEKEIGREVPPGDVSSTEGLLKVYTETDAARYLVIFDLDLAQTTNDRAVRRVEYDFKDENLSYSLAGEFEELRFDLSPWINDELEIAPMALVTAPWERRDLSRFAHEEENDSQFSFPEAASEYTDLTNRYAVLGGQHRDYLDVNTRYFSGFGAPSSPSEHGPNYKAVVTLLVGNIPDSNQGDTYVSFFREMRNSLSEIGEDEIPSYMEPTLRSEVEDVVEDLREVFGEDRVETPDYLRS